jgi:hypothetical protein
MEWRMILDWRVYFRELKDSNFEAAAATRFASGLLGLA